jgi:hypothetical protein
MARLEAVVVAEILVPVDRRYAPSGAVGDLNIFNLLDYERIGGD